MAPICEPFLQFDDQPYRICNFLAHGFDPETQVFESMVKWANRTWEVLLCISSFMDGCVSQINGGFPMVFHHTYSSGESGMKIIKID